MVRSSTHGQRSNDIRRKIKVKVGLSSAVFLSVILAVAIVATSHLAFYTQRDSIGRTKGSEEWDAWKSDRNDAVRRSQTLVHGDSSMSGTGEVRYHRDSSLQRPRNYEQVRYHVVFSTDCSAYQHWQSYLLFFSAMKVDQPGHVTRIASGCTDEEAARELEWHNTHIKEAMSDRFGLHFTPHFSSVTKDGKTTGDYKFFNKPFGLKHWMEYGEGMGLDSATGKMKDEDVVVILLDPDMILMRPISVDFSDPKSSILGDDVDSVRVKHGVPFAQIYGLGSQWRRFDLAEIAGGDSPAQHVSEGEARKKYPAGPPYIATARDMYSIAVKWAEFAPKVHAEYPNLLAEMYAYCIAAAHVKLPHQMVHSLMVSNTKMEDEGWSLIDSIPEKEVCVFGSSIDPTKDPVPGVLHYCQRYMIGKVFFGKRRVPKDFFTCESPLLVVPPSDLASQYSYFIPPPPHKPKGEKKPLSSKVAKRETFMLCTLISSMNEAGDFFKRKHCEGTKKEKSMDLWK